MLSQTTQYPLMYAGQSSAQIAERYLPRLERLQKEGFDVHVLAGDDGGFELLRRRGIFARPLPVGFTLNVAGWLGAYVIMQAYFIEERPVLVHALDIPMVWPAAFAARRADVPAVFVTVDHHVLPSNPIGRGMQAAYELLATWSDKYLVTNRSELSNLQALELVEPRKLELVASEDDEQILSLYDEVLSRHFQS